MSASIQAGVQSLFVQAGVALANNKGDLGATLKQLGSSATLRALASAMVAAGLTAHLEQVAGLDGKLSGTGQVVQRGLIRATVRAGVSTAIQGGSLDENLITALRWQAASVIGEVAAEKIGAAAEARDIDRVTKYIAHAALGCGLGEVVGGGCAGGAAGGVAGEMVGDWVRADIEARLARGDVSGEDLQRWVAQGVDLARLAGGVGAWLATGEAGAGAAALQGGAQVAENAARHNALFLIPLVWAILEIADKALTLKDAYDLAKAMRAGDEEKARELSTSLAIGMLSDGIPGNTVIKKVLGIFGKKGKAVSEKVVADVDVAKGADKSLGNNPFKGKTKEQIADMFKKKGFEPKGKEPLNGKGTFVNPKTGRGYHIDSTHAPPKGPHVGVHRPRGAIRDKLRPRDYPLE